MRVLRLLHFFHFFFLWLAREPRGTVGMGGIVYLPPFRDQAGSRKSRHARAGTNIQ